MGLSNSFTSYGYSPRASRKTLSKAGFSIVRLLCVAAVVATLLTMLTMLVLMVNAMARVMHRMIASIFIMCYGFILWSEVEGLEEVPEGEAG